MRLRLSVNLAMACLLLLAPWPRVAHAQVESREGIALQNQIYELRQQIETLRQQIGSGGGSSYLGRQGYAQPQTNPNDMVAQLLSRVDSLDDQVRQLRGRVDELQNQTQRQGADLGKRIDDLSFQLQNPQVVGAPAVATPGAEMAPGAAVPQQAAPMTGPPPTSLGIISAQGPTQLGMAPVQPPQPPARRTPELAIQEGNSALARRDYTAAEAAAREVLSNYRTSPRAYDAQFVLAQALAGERQYSQAAIAYDDTYNRNRKGGHAPDALVGLANSLTAINEKRAACDTLTKLHAEFPQTRPDLREAITSVHQRAGCR